MADKEDRSADDLTEEASPFKVEEFREKGQVAQSRELTGIVGLIAMSIALMVMSPRIVEQVITYMREIFNVESMLKLNLQDQSIAGNQLMKSLKLIIALVLPIAATGFLVSVVSGFAQVGSIFSFDPIQPDFSKVNPISGLQRMFSMHALTEGLRLTIKLAIILFVTWTLIQVEVFRSPGYAGIEPISQLMSIGKVTKAFFFTLIAVLIVFSIIDFGMQRWEFSKKVRMTKEEAKEEHKEREGDPHVRARIRAVQREMARKRMMQAVKKADVIITNPTHIAVALQYDKLKMKAPRVVAKGADFLAQQIKKVAADAGIPLVENVPLARTLYKSVKVNQWVPRNLYQAVAEVLAYVYRLKNRLN